MRAYLLGQPVAHSLSPVLHNAAFAALGIDAQYAAWDVSLDELATVMELLRAKDCFGANVTAPHKRAVMSYLDHLDDESLALGAVNTIVNRDGYLSGGNTDAEGLARWMRLSRIDSEHGAAVVLGAGGAAGSAVWALSELGATSVTVLNRTAERAQNLVTSLRPKLHGVDLMWGALEEAAEPVVRPWRVVVNATSMGHHGSAPDVHPSWYSRDSVAIELAYNPPETEFMVAAREAGARAENGLGMLLHQAALAFERWTGREAPMDVYEAALTRAALASTRTSA